MSNFVTSCLAFKGSIITKSTLSTLISNYFTFFFLHVYCVGAIGLKEKHKQLQKKNKNWRKLNFYCLPPLSLIQI